MHVSELTETNKMSIRFTQEPYFEALVLLGIVGKLTTEQEAKELSFCLSRDDVVRDRYDAIQTEAGEGRYYPFAETYCEVVEDMTAQERAELRRRVLGA